MNSWYSLCILLSSQRREHRVPAHTHVHSSKHVHTNKQTTMTLTDKDTFTFLILSFCKGLHAAYRCSKVSRFASHKLDNTPAPITYFTVKTDKCKCSKNSILVIDSLLPLSLPFSHLFSNFPDTNWSELEWYSCKWPPRCRFANVQKFNNIRFVRKWMHWTHYEHVDVNYEISKVRWESFLIKEEIRETW